MSKTTIAEGVRRVARRKDDETAEASDVDQVDEVLRDRDPEVSSDHVAEAGGERSERDHGPDVEDAVSKEDEKKGDDGDVRRLTIGRVGFVTPALAGVTLVLAVMLVVLGVSNHHHESDVAAGDAARTEVTQHVTKMLSYTPTTVGDFSGNEVWLTGGFKSKYHSLMSDKVAPEAKESGVSATAQVVQAAVTSASSDRVEMLMFINVKLTAKGMATPQETGSRVRVGATRVDGRWLIDRFDTL